MTRKDYEMIAKIIKKHRDDSAMAKAEFSEMIYSFSEYLAYDNMRFNSEKFEQACGLDSHWNNSPSALGVIFNDD